MNRAVRRVRLGSQRLGTVQDARDGRTLVGDIRNVLRGIRVKTSRTDRRPLEQARLQRWCKTHWVPFGKVLSTPR